MRSDDLEIDRAQLEDGSPPGRAHNGQPAPAVSVLWYRLRASPWRTLALVAPSSDSWAWRLAQELRSVEDAWAPAVKVVNAMDATVGRVSALGHALFSKKLQSTQERFIIVTDSPLVNPVAIGLLTACDAVVLLLERRRTRIPDAQRILELVGRERFIGAVLGPS